MKNRNTLGQQWKPIQKNQANSVERKTMTNPTIPTQPQIRQVNQQQLNQKMCQKITKVLSKIPQQGKRTSISSIIQPKASTLFNTISTFMNFIDHTFQKSNVDVEVIPQILNFWGYPHSYNKSVFQPIGAPHTWPSCLQMMQFLADVTNYVFQYRSTIQQYKLDVQQIDLILDAFSKENNQQFDAYLQKQKADLMKQQEQLVYKIQSSEITLKNIKNSQRSVVQMQTQQQILTQKLQRQSQNVIQIDQKNNLLINQIQKTDENLEEQQITKSSLLKRIQILQEEISNQQLSFEQASKIQFQINQYHTRINDAQNEAEVRKKQYQEEKNKIVQFFYKIVDDINSIKNNVKIYQPELLKRGIQMPVPQSDHVSFTQAIHTQDMNLFNQAIGRMIQIDKVKSMLISQQSLADVLDHQFKVINNQLAQTQSKKEEIDNENKQAIGQVQKLQKLSQQLTKQINQMTMKLSQFQDQKQSIKQESNSIKQQSESLLKTQIQLTQQAKLRKQHMAEGIRMLKKYETDCDNTIKIMEQKQQQTRKKIQQILQRIQGGFSFLNKQLESLL